MSLLQTIGFIRSDENTLHEVTDERTSVLQFDDEYFTVFWDAVQKIIAADPDDTYLNLMNRGKWSVENAVVRQVHGKGCVDWSVTFHSAHYPEREVLIRLNTPNASQLKWDGSCLSEEHLIQWRDRHLSPSAQKEAADREARAEQKREEEEALRRREWIREFLGVELGVDCPKYVDAEDRRHGENRGGLLYGKARVEKSFEFEDYYVITRKGESAVIGLCCEVEAGKIGDENAYIDKVWNSLLAEVSKDSLNPKVTVSNDGRQVTLYSYFDDRDHRASLKILNSRGSGTGKVTLEFVDSSIRTLKTDIPEVVSFLGVVFGRDAKDYIVENAVGVPFKDETELFDAKMNHLLSFDTYKIIKPVGKDFVAGVVCSVSKDKLANTVDYMNEVLSIIEEKFGVEPQVSKTKTGFFFYNGRSCDKKRFTTSIFIYEEGDQVVLRVFNKLSHCHAVEFERAEKEKLEQEQEQRKKELRQNALDSI